MTSYNIKNHACMRTDSALTTATFSFSRNRLLSIQVRIYKTIGCRYELSLCFVLCLSFMFVFIFLKNIFHISVARGIKPTSTCFQVLSRDYEVPHSLLVLYSSPTHSGAGDGGVVCLLAGGPLDCSQSSILRKSSVSSTFSNRWPSWFQMYRV